jgi:hypothetical protein
MGWPGQQRADWARFHQLQADAVTVGAGTLRTERFARIIRGADGAQADLAART